MRCIWIVYTRLRSVEVLQVTGSLVLRILLWCLAIVCFSLALNGSDCDKVVAWFVMHSAWYQRSSSWLCKVTVYITDGTMASVTLGVAGPEMTVVGSVFAASCRHRGTRPSHTWTWESPGVVKLDTSVVRDVLGLRVLYRFECCPVGQTGSSAAQ